uniref:Uncharacterized protein MANES_15G101000 n=1 Tax=Rhizophora mucronata TaxID=61149 RepID=A0A2P2LW02_RHIMU
MMELLLSHTQPLQQQYKCLKNLILVFSAFSLLHPEFLAAAS